MFADEVKTPISVSINVPVKAIRSSSRRARSDVGFIKDFSMGGLSTKTMGQT
jgi:hypothetical protein